MRFFALAAFFFVTIGLGSSNAGDEDIIRRIGQYEGWNKMSIGHLVAMRSSVSIDAVDPIRGQGGEAYIANYSGTNVVVCFYIELDKDGDYSVIGRKTVASKSDCEMAFHVN